MMITPLDSLFEVGLSTGIFCSHAGIFVLRTIKTDPTVGVSNANGVAMLSSRDREAD
jgi:hypothetical protein